MSRILEYRRIELHSIAKVNIKGISVEPIIHAAAELLDNATRYSPPQTKVHVTATEVQTGIAVEIEDGGISLGEENRAKVERMLAEAQAGVDVQELARHRVSASPSSDACRRCSTCMSRCGSPRTAESAPSSSSPTTC